MKSVKKILAVILTAFLLVSVLPLTASAAYSYAFKMTGNRSAEITVLTGTVTEATIKDGTVATVSRSGNTVTVTGAEDAVGIAVVTITVNSDSFRVEVPIGYTTVMFAKDALEIYEGDDAGYEVIGIDPSDPSVKYTVGDQSRPLPAYPAVDGGTIYKNTDDYRLCVNIKKEGGTYVLRGNGADMSVCVDENLTADTHLLFCGLTLASSFTAPLTVAQQNTAAGAPGVELTVLTGLNNKLSDTAKNNAEGAVVRGKAGTKLLLNGTGVLTLDGAEQDAVRIGAYGSLTVDGVYLTANAVRNGICCDNTVLIRSGEMNITAAGDAVCCTPDTVNEAAGCAGDLRVEGGTLTLKSGSDGIRAANDLTVTGGTFHITAGKGFSDTGFDAGTMSCKGLCAAGKLTVSGGTFDLNTADDAIHSDAAAEISAGILELKSGKDAIHAAAALKLGTDGGTYNALKLTVLNSRIGLAAGAVNIYSGTHEIKAADDGINAAGGADGSGGSGWNVPAGSADADSVRLHGGIVTVNADGDGIDAKADLNLTGGRLTVWGQPQGGDNCPLSSNGNLFIKNATVFAAGSGKAQRSPTSGSQPYVTSTEAIPRGKTVNIKYKGTTVFNIAAVKDIDYVLYSAPDMTSDESWTVIADNSAIIDPGNIDSRTECEKYGHQWGPGVQLAAPTCTESGKILYTCTVCSAEQTGIVPALGHNFENGFCTRCSAPDPNGDGFMVTFEAEHCIVTTYRTRSTTDVDQTNAKTAVARNAQTGEPDASGNGELNFTVKAESGYWISGYSADGCFESLQSPEQTGSTYRVTGVYGDVTVTFKAEVSQPPVTEDPCTGYTDVDRKSWYHSAVDFALQYGLMGSTQTGKLTFEPATPCTRGMIVTILYSLANKPAVSYVAKFPDVKDGQWYTAPVMWAYQKGVVSGYDNGLFGTNDKVTREQMAVILKAYSEKIGRDTTGRADISGYPDAGKVTWSKDAVSWAVSEGLISGKAQNGKTYLDPQGKASRAEVAVILMKFLSPYVTK